MFDIVCTIGPASQAAPVQQMLRRLTNRFRLNTGHLDAGALRLTLDHLSKSVVDAEASEPLRVALDLQGAKVRIGEFHGGWVDVGTVELRLGKSCQEPWVIPVPFACVFEQSAPGDELLLNDGRIRLRVTERPDSHRLLAECVQPGALSSAKGLNRPARPYRLSSLSIRDQESIRIGLEYPFVEFAVSFVVSAGEAELLRPLVGTRRLIAKIERLAACEAIDELAEAFDELWLCRGDLGSEVEPYQLGKVQRDFNRQIALVKKPCLLAGEVLGSLMHQPLPTRSEIVHLYDTLQAGYAGIVLSDETAIGSHVSQLVEFLTRFRQAHAEA